MTKARWITIGTVLTGHFVVLQNWGCPNGFLMTWQGRVSWCQPLEFLDWHQVLWAVERRLNLAKLDMIAVASELPGEYQRVTLRVLVRRYRNPGAT